MIDVAGNGNLRASPVSVDNNVPAPTAEVVGVAITSDPGADRMYVTEEVIEVTVTFDVAVDVDTTNGIPRLRIGLVGGLNAAHDGPATCAARGGRRSSSPTGSRRATSRMRTVSWS